MRARLPDRRPHVLTRIEFGGQRWHLACGFDTAGKVREVFASGHKIGSASEAIHADACIAISILLQSGHDAADLIGRFGAEGDIGGREADPGPSSLFGAIVRAAARLESEEGPEIAAHFARQAVSA